MPAPPLRCLVVWLVASATAGALVAWMAPLALSAPAGPAFDDLLVRLCSAVAVLSTTWLWVGTSVTVLEALRGRVRPARGVPAPLRRAVLAACGAGLLAGLATPALATPALATPGEVHTDRGPAAALAGLPLPDRAVGLPGRASIATGQLRPPAPAATSVTVRPGDTLWDLASVHLGDPRRWPEIYALNRAAIGTDPSLIHPATRLRLPADRPEETS